MQLSNIYEFFSRRRCVYSLTLNDTLLKFRISLNGIFEIVIFIALLDKRNVGQSRNYYSSNCII